MVGEDADIMVARGEHGSVSVILFSCGDEDNDTCGGIVRSTAARVGGCGFRPGRVTAALTWLGGTSAALFRRRVMMGRGLPCSHTSVHLQRLRHLIRHTGHCELDG